MLKLVLETQSETKEFSVTEAQRDIINDCTSAEAEIKGVNLFKEITGKNINYFVCIDKGNWFFWEGE